jgi:hypothetical protein
MKLSLQEMMKTDDYDDLMAATELSGNALNFCGAPVAIISSCSTLDIEILNSYVDKGWFMTNFWYKIRGKVKNLKIFLNWANSAFNGRSN